MPVTIHPYDPARLQPSHNNTIFAHNGVSDPRLPFGSAFGVLRRGMAQEPMVDPETSKIYVPIAGEAELEADGTVYPLRPGSVILIPAGTYHAVRQVGEVDFVNFCLWWGDKR
jgi:mannose-6-phosphate isomerase-like protein (cupin superfamily)